MDVIPATDPCSGEAENLKKINIAQAWLLVVGSMAGSGILALPQALTNTGWIGVVLIALGAFVFGYNGILYGRCWEILAERYPKYHQHVRDPLPVITEEAFGRFIRHAVAALMDVAQILYSTIYLLVASQNMQSLFEQAGLHISYRYWILILALVLILPSWLPTPKDFWLAATIASGTTGLASILIIISLVSDERACAGHASSTQNVSLMQFSSGIATIFFSYNGAAMLLVIQQDMRKIQDFTTAVLLGFLTLVAVYIPVAVTGYIACGASTQSNVLQTMPHGGLRITAEILVTAHMVFAYILVINPALQHAEHIFQLPKAFSWKHRLVRCALVVITFIIGEAVPQMGNLMALMGGTMVTLMSCLIPSVSYMRLCSREGPWIDRYLPLYIKVFIVETLLVAVLVGLVGTYSAFVDIIATYTNFL